MATFSQIEQDFYDIVGEPSNSTVYPGLTTSGTYTLLLANRAEDTICRQKNWWFLKTKYLFVTALPTTLDGGVETTDITIDLISASDNIPSSGAIWCEGDVISYTGVSSNTLTGVTNIDIAHSSGANVEILYALPSDFSHSPVLTVQTQGGNYRPLRMIQVEDLDYGVDSADDRSFGFGDETDRWSIVTDKDGNEYMRINLKSTEKAAMLHYYKEQTEMTASGSTATIPDPFARKILPLQMAHIAMQERGDNPDGLAEKIEENANNELEKMGNYNTRRKMEGIRPKTFNMYRSGNNRIYRQIIIN